jgi:hypothetical protein
VIAGRQFDLQFRVSVGLKLGEQGASFQFLAIELSNSLGWELRYRTEARYNTHNHPPSQSPAAHPSHRHLSIQALATSKNLFLAG